MFQLAEIRHMVRIPPWLFGQTLNDAVVEELNRKLANKVVLNVGLCIALFDVTSLGDSYIFPGDGASHTRVTFRYVVFRPFMEEILEGTIKSADAEGLQVSLGFYEDVYIRRDAMMTNSHFDETDGTWVWDYQTDDETHHLFMDIGEKVRFKVIAEQFTDTTPSAPGMTEGDGAVTDRKEGKIPYIVFGAINDQGLGLVSWWTNASGDQGDEEREEEEEEEEEEA
ncbi:DNA-directed RNA polymerase III subunit RPC8-like [Penaeus japonicus]|uniref:DNA-directed RNA polymerase III subunit RPC8-like n=1 Tax=Penaeus japonicus TaxID=27405 RepID=UPI001C70B2C1|nr:DNA-directed RNA polymerase III subunit RPC8-like [Penaeus japonicus]XP_042859043.1 DNA-directed RNA polymerase III subunit RPC8-like [Penaeus japonicus]XP_042859044.1 DNA-directed RNA polymerase III subunit RPC8-like [Penaeus japonicus]XP_042859045.1 DNA-directed RNA polymerase III subunit RPC8-like [Penaeus japonicus]